MNDIMKTVEKLNEMLYEKGIENHIFSASSTGYMECILLDNTVLWNSENDEREFDKEKNEYEDMYIFILSQIERLISSYSGIVNRKQEE